MAVTPVVLVHGGAGDIPVEAIPAKLDGVKRACATGYKILESGGSALDAAQAAVEVMEEDPAFNAGYFHKLFFCLNFFHGREDEKFFSINICRMNR